MNTKCSQFLNEKGYTFNNLPRIDGQTKSLWNSDGCIYKNIKAVRNFYTKYLTEYRPDIVVIVPYERGAFEIELINSCKRLGVKTLLLQEGLIITDENKEACLVHMPDEYFKLRRINKATNTSMDDFLIELRKKINGGANTKSLLKSAVRKLFYPSLPECKPFGMNGADYVGTLSAYYANKLIERGLAPRQLRPVGLARFDEIEKYRKDNISTLDRSNQEKISILLCQSWGFELGSSPSDVSSVESEITRAQIISNSFPGRVIVKYRIRPEEHLNNYKKYLNIFNKSLILEEASKIPVYESIMESDLIVTTGSTILLEALSLGKIGILFDPSRKDYYGYVRFGGCLMAHDDESLVSAIQEILQFPRLQAVMLEKAQKYVVERAMIDGRASERTCQFIKDIIDGL